MRRGVGVLVVGVALAAAVAVAAGRGGAAAPRTTIATVQIKASNGSSARGLAYFRQRGRTLSGSVAVWGLVPLSRHAVHAHGPKGKCTQSADPVAAHSDLVADANGVASITFRTVATHQVLRGGFYYNVHLGPSSAGKTAEIACADLRGVRTTR